METERENILNTVEDISAFVQLKSVIGEKQKDKYNLTGVYWTRYMTQYGIRHLFKNKGNLVFNHKLRKYVHISKTPMKYYFHYTETVKNRALTNE